MNTPRYAAAAAKLIGKYLPVGSGEGGDEARGMATIERAMLARSRRRRLVTVSAALGAAAAIVLTAQLMKPNPHPSADPVQVSISATPSGKGAAVGQGLGAHELGAHTSVASGQRIETAPQGGASLRLSTGTSIDLAGHTSFQVDTQGAIQRFSLQHGELAAHVAKLTSAQRFIVDTPDAEVEVRGTRFRLRVVEGAEACGGGTRTRLDVSEGVVEVRTMHVGTIAVKAGQIWPTDCSNRLAPGVAPAALPSAASTTAVEKREITRAVTPSANHNASEPLSALAAPNDLFAEGVAHRRQGDISGALRLYQDLLNRFPGNPLAENAVVERMRLLSGSVEGRQEAKRYLARYPQGFAVDEARRFAVEP